MAQKYVVRLDEDQDTTLELREEGGVIWVRREGEANPWRRVALERVGDSSLYLVMIDSRPIELYLDRRRGGAIVTIGRHVFNYDVGPWRPSGGHARAGGRDAGVRRIVAPMTGSIVEVRCTAGQRVSRGDVLLVVESMKMNNELRSPADGVVEQVGVTAGQKVKQGDLLVALGRGESA